MAKRHDQAYRLYKRGETWHAYISYIGTDRSRTQLRCSCRTTERAKAEQYVIEKINKIEKKSIVANGEYLTTTVDEAFARYYLEKAQYQTRPQQSLTRLNNLKKWMNVKYLHEINEPIISEIISKQRSNFSNSTLNRYLALLSVVLNTAMDEWHYKCNNIKISKLKLKEPDENIKYLKNWDMAQTIIDRAADHLKPIIYTALYTGLRESNILNLKWTDIDFQNNIITLKVKDRTTVGGKIHSIPIIPQLCEILSKQKKVNEYVFNFRGKPVTSISRSWHNIFYKFVPATKEELTSKDVIENRVRKGRLVSYKRVLRDPELPYTNFHTLRHTAATWILKKTNNLKITQQILGHADIKTTLKYAHVLDDEKRKALESVFD